VSAASRAVVNRLSKPKPLVGVVHNGIVVLEEVNSENPLSPAWSVHELHYAGSFLPLVPHVSVHDILIALNVKSEIWNLFVVLLGAFAGHERVSKGPALTVAQEMIGQFEEVFIWDHV